MFCKRCGTEITQTIRICPTCGALIENPSMNSQPQPPYGVFAQSGREQSAQRPRGYAPPPYDNVASPLNGYTPPAAYKNAQAYEHDSYTSYAPSPNAFMGTNKNNTALITEVLLSLVGIFGVGWIMTGKTIVGIILLLGSIFIYWPIMILGTIFTLGAGLICLGPIAIIAIILNFILINKVLNRK